MDLHGNLWVVSFGSNVVSYLTIIVLGVICKYVVLPNISNYNARAILQPWFEDYEEEQSPKDPPTYRELNQTNSTWRRAVQLIVCVAGLQISFVVWGLLQERMMTRTYKLGNSDVMFQETEFLVFVNRLVALIVSSGYLLYAHRPRFGMALYRFLYPSLSNIISSWTQYEALRYVSFPTQVITKACKVIPVMLVGKLISKRTYSIVDYLVAFTISIGSTVFLLSEEFIHHNGKGSNVETTVSGLLLLVIYVGTDSFTSNYQSNLFNRYRLSSMQMMFGTNMFSALFTLSALSLNGGLLYSLNFMMDYPDFLCHALLTSLCSAVGQLFIFYTISSFGPIIFSVIMTSRQVISLLFSCIFFQHRLSSSAIMGAATVFGGLGLGIYSQLKRRKQAEASPSPTRI